MSRLLKIKSKVLAEEARIIRKEERRVPEGVRELLHTHRVRDVRVEARATFLARGFLKGRQYRTLEGITRRPLPETVKERALRMVQKYGPTVEKNFRLDDWFEEELNADVDRGSAAASAAGHQPSS